MDIKFFPTIPTSRVSFKEPVKSIPRKNFRFSGKIVRARHSGENEPSRYIITITTDDNNINPSDLLNRDIVVTSE